MPDLTAKATSTNIDGTVEQPLTARRLTKDRGGQGRPGVLYRWAALMATHWRTVLVVWAVVVSACIIAMPAVEKSLKAPDFNVTTAESTEAARILDRDFPSVAPSKMSSCSTSVNMTSMRQPRKKRYCGHCRKFDRSQAWPRS